ncbi:hypothetical protein BDY24DRAFT_388768 [Mrakia frigida]|uniref:uncharacterized protein n=1 Tax=Mrakia frigida TaxID=29902 RepID=UPI003FCBF0DC
MLPLLYSSLFGNLNPKRCSFQVVNRPFYGHHWLEIRDGSSLLGWSRIQKMDIIGVVLFTRSPTSLLAGVPPSSSGQAQVVRLYVSTLLSWNCADPTSLVDEIGNYSFFDGLEFMQDRSFVLVVRSEEEKTEVEAAVRTSQKIARWRHVFAVELET